MIINNKDEELEFGFEFFSPIIDFKSFDEDISYHKRFSGKVDTFFTSQENIASRLDELPKIIIRNMYIYLNYLKYLVKSKEKVNNDLYKNKQIKIDIQLYLDISFIVLYGHNKRLIKLPQYYLLCIKELEIIYNLKCIDFFCPFDNIWKNETKEYIKQIKNNKNKQILLAYKIY